MRSRYNLSNAIKANPFFINCLVDVNRLDFGSNWALNFWQVPLSFNDLVFVVYLNEVSLGYAHKLRLFPVVTGIYGLR
jgi:hypothetical protein